MSDHDMYYRQDMEATQREYMISAHELAIEYNTLLDVEELTYFRYMNRLERLADLPVEEWRDALLFDKDLSYRKYEQASKALYSFDFSSIPDLDNLENI